MARTRIRSVLFATAAIAALGGLAQAEISPLPAVTQQLVSYADIVAQTKPAVVTITTMAAAKPQLSGMGGMGERGGQDLTPFDFFQQFFNNNGQIPGQLPPGQYERRMPDAPPARALGSGFIVSDDGMIVTNNHVIDGATAIRVTLDDGSEHEATLIGTDPKTDLAVIKITTDKALPTLEWGDSSGLRVGDPIVAIGNPFGVGTTVTSGIVSARGRDIHNGPYDDFIQVDAAINHGNSGGPLLDATGHVVGVNAAIYSPNDGNVGVGFAIPSEQAQGIVATLMQSGSVSRGYLGVQIQPVTPDLAEAVGLSDASGAIVTSVQPDTPASKAGVQAGDVIVAVNGTSIKDARALSRLVAGLEPGKAQAVDVFRSGAKITLDVTLAELPAEDAAQVVPARADGSETLDDLGVSLTTITPEARARLGLPADVSGLIVTEVTSANPDLDLRPGDVIETVDMTPVATIDQVQDAVSSAHDAGREAILVKVLRQGSVLFIGLPVKAA